MKKILFSSLIVLLLMSCSTQDDETSSYDGGKFKNLESYEFETLDDAANFFHGKMEKIETGDPHSELWPEESNTKNDGRFKAPAASTVYELHGYTHRTVIQSGNTMFYTVSPPLKPLMYYLYTRYHYKYRIEIPKGASLILPPEATMNGFANQGWNPEKTSVRGYEYVYIGVSGESDVYDLVTISDEIQYDVNGRLLFNPPINLPGYIDVNNITWKYSYEEAIIW